jgi:uncharacterized protein
MRQTYIKKEVALSKIPARYKPVVNDANSALLKNFPDKIHSIYLYGSVATGKAKSPTSDLDLLIVLEAKPTQKTKTALKELSDSLSQKYQREFREVGFAVTYKNEALRGKETFALNFFITILCVKIFGDNLFPKGTKFAITKRLACSLNPDIDTSIEEAKKNIKSASNDEAVIKIQSMMKKIIRTAFNLVMVEENHWTTDLDEMTKIFTKHYPDKKEQIKDVLEIAKSKSPNKKESILILDTFGKWISKEFALKCSV